MTIHRKTLWLAAAAIGCLSLGCKKANSGSSESATPNGAPTDPAMQDDAAATAPSEGEEGDASAPAGEECTEEHAAMGHCTREDAGGTPPS